MIPFSRKSPTQQNIPINPDYAETHYNRGFIHSDSGMYREAIEAYKQAIQIKPDFAEANNNLGICYVILNNKSGALGEYNVLKNIDPQSAIKLFNLIYER